MKQDKALQLQQTAQNLRKRILALSEKMYQASVNGQNYNRTIENMLTAEAQLELLVDVIKEDPVEVKEPAKAPLKELKKN